MSTNPALRAPCRTPACASRQIRAACAQGAPRPCSPAPASLALLVRLKPALLRASAHASIAQACLHARALKPCPQGRLRRRRPGCACRPAGRSGCARCRARRFSSEARALLPTVCLSQTQAPTGEAMRGALAASVVSPAWRLLLLSDGSVTRHLQIVSGGLLNCHVAASHAETHPWPSPVLHTIHPDDCSCRQRDGSGGHTPGRGRCCGGHRCRAFPLTDGVRDAGASTASTPGVSSVSPRLLCNPRC